MAEFTFRLAQPSDSEAFAAWVQQNGQVDSGDIQAGLKKNSPTAVVFVVEKDGKPIVFAPFVCVMQLCHLGFSPESRASEKVKALEVMLRGAEAFAYQYGLREINTLTREDFGVAKWAAANGFVKDSRELFRYDLNTGVLARELEAAETHENH